MSWPRLGRSLRQQLLWGLLLPIALFVLADTVSLYRQALSAVNTAYDRTLLASAKAIGELLDVQREGEQTRILARIPYSALEAFEADNRSRMTYRVSELNGAWVDGAQDLPAWQGTIPQQGPYAALVDFYDAQWRGDAVRVAILLQPIATPQGKTMAMVQVAETLELRRELARSILWDTLQRQAFLILVITLIALVVVLQVTRPIGRLSQTLAQRAPDDLTPLPVDSLPAEVRPLVDATNGFMARLHQAMDHQKRFVRDAAHQLRTPLAVLKLQIQSARRGDTPPHAALAELETTVDRATLLANQMLSLAKIEQLRQSRDFTEVDWADIVRDLALEMAPMVADKDIDFGLDCSPATVMGHPWMLREITRNLLHNAIRHTPRAGRLDVLLRRQAQFATLDVVDSGEGISDTLRQRLFQPFATTDARSGSGLGLTIAREMVHTLGGQITLSNRTAPDGKLLGLTASVSLPCTTPPAKAPPP
ncbi:sensor histidine kinase N-terminal domain-containing protein [Curvibacter sp. APW13]|uniref:sensor histidine kinase n=1 Tax=Curvibacter sp. APW13 TaxID=3077236 RepID=UPI0028DEA498|nr:sensor histidine kinase N-terminal domain-containing protein [Curvibacter sp. APW13]MDT8991430.1 sensor histidine kinase N-terminal domain-containing protein [Curvibacter sp. APW13]